MSFSNSILTIPAVSAAIGVALVVVIHEYSLDQTALVREQVAAARAAEAAAREQAEAEKIAAAKKRAEQARAAKAAAARAAMLAALPGDPKKGRMKYMTCLGCHGLKAEGSRGFNAPRLAGQAPWYLKSQMSKFKEGVRGTHPTDVGGQQMAPMARLMVGTAVDDVIAYIAGIEPGKPADRGPGDAAAGEESFALCSTCHGRAAEGREANKAPRLSHQHAWYLEKQLRNFRGGVRGAHAADIEGQQMAAIAQTLSDDKGIADLIAYIQSLDR